MADNYEIALFLHIVGVFGIAGAAVSFWIAMSVMRRIPTVQEMRSWSTLAVWSDRAFPASAVLVILAGAFMVEDVDWGWGTGWINTSLIALILMGAGGGLLMTPRVRKIHEAAAATPDGPVPSEIRDLVNDPILWGTLHAFTLGLFGIIWNMTTKPGDAQSGTVILLAFVLGAASAYPMFLRGRD
jgi:uncharacterized membrane protein